MISNEQIKNTIEDCAKHKHIVTVRDIAYALLCLQLEDSLIAYKCIFGNDYDYNQEYHNTYDQTAMMSYLKTYVEVSLISGRGKRKNTEDISFEENKAYMLKLKKDTEEAIEKKEIDKKDGLKILADLSVKLNDRFKVSAEERDQMIVVNAKYDSICPRCGSEVSRRPITKEEAMDMYNLIEVEKELE
jgi:hypothetical protein